MTKNRRLWFLRTGNHLCFNLFGTGGTEYGDKTFYIKIPFGVLVYRVRRWTYKEIVVFENNNATEEFLAHPEWVWDDFETTRMEDGII